MEKITSWLHRPSPHVPQQEDAFFWDDGKVKIFRNGNDSGEYYDGTWLYNVLRVKQYDKLQRHMQDVYNFLHATIGD